MHVGIWTLTPGFKFNVQSFKKTIFANNNNNMSLLKVLLEKKNVDGEAFVIILWCAIFVN